MMILKVVKRIFIVLFCLIFVLVLGYSGTLLFENIQAHQKIANIVYIIDTDLMKNGGVKIKFHTPAIFIFLFLHQ